MSGYPNARTLAPFLIDRPDWLVLAQERFLTLVITAPSDCWLWQGRLDVNGYGRFRADKRDWMAHRFSYEVNRGAVPTDRVLDHLCRVRNCVNPDHLEIVTQKENLRRGGTGWAGGEPGAQATHCIHGHAYTPENTYVFPNRQNARSCRICSNRRQREYEERKRKRAA